MFVNRVKTKYLYYKKGGNYFAPVGGGGGFSLALMPKSSITCSNGRCSQQNLKNLSSKPL